MSIDYPNNIIHLCICYSSIKTKHLKIGAELLKLSCCGNFSFIERFSQCRAFKKIIMNSGRIVQLLINALMQSVDNVKIVQLPRKG